MKRLMDESDDSTVDGLVVDDGGGSSTRPAPRFRSSASAPRRGGSTRSPSSSSTSPPTAGWRSCSSSTSIPRTRASCATRWPRPRPMTVSQAEDGTAVEPNHVYVIPPDADIAIHRGRLTLASRALDGRRSHLSVDGFLRSLAADRGSHAIGVVLSGNASDGTEGLRAIKAENGITLAQDPESAKYGEMPRNAVNAGVVDAALAIPDLARELVRLSRHPYVAAAEGPPAAGDARRPQSDPDGRAQRGRRRLQRVQAGDGGAPAGPQDGASPRAGSAGLSGDPARGSGGGARPLRGHPHSRHLVLQGSGGVRGAGIADPARHPEGQAGRGADSSLGGRVLDRRRGVLDRDRAARAPGRLLAPRPDLRLRSERADHRQGARRHSTATLRCAT